MTTQPDPTGTAALVSAESEALAEAQQWLARHGVAAPDPAPVSTTTRRPERRTGQSADAAPDDSESLARTVVFRKLAAQARTRYELDQALRAKDIPDPVAAKVLDRMEEVGLIDDTAFAHDWVESRQQRRQLSRRALRHELERKGVERDDIDDALQSVDAHDEYEAARSLVERKAGSMRGLSRDVRYRRLLGVLARRGFSGVLCVQVIAEVLAEAEPPG